MTPQPYRKRIPYGMTNFEDLRTDDCYFVDKTAYIEQIEWANKFFFFIRPRRFGKTLLISMLQKYYDVNCAAKFEQLFGDLYIGQHPTPKRNAYLILHLNFSTIDGGLGDYRSAMNELCFNEFSRFCRAYRHLLPEETLEELSRRSGAVSQLDYLYKTCDEVGRKIYLFIDEYDHFTNAILTSDERLTDYEDETHGEGYLRKFFNTVKSGTSSSIERCFVTGVSPVTMDDLTSGFNIGTNYSASPDFNAMVGFTESEVRDMLTYYAATVPFSHTVDQLLAAIKPWYDNYRFAARSAEDATMYNSNMVLYFVDNYIRGGGRFPEAMIDVNIRTDYDRLRMLIRRDREFAHDASVIQTIVSQGYILGSIKNSFPARYITRPDNFISLLYYFGMLTIDKVESGQLKLVIPNEVVREQIYTYLLNAYQEADLHQEDYVRTALASRLAFQGEWSPYFAYIADCLHQYASTRDVQKGESFVHGFTLAMTSLNAYYRPQSEHDCGQGYADLLLVPELNIWKDIQHSYLIEFKYIKRSAPQAQVEEARVEATAQARRYAVTSSVGWQIANTHLHRLVIVYYGFDMAVCEEV
jgi:hypothetical protein